MHASSRMLCCSDMQAVVELGRVVVFTAGDFTVADTCQQYAADCR